MIMHGELHIEMALWNTIRELLEESGWTKALCDAGVVTSGTADFLMKQGAVITASLDKTSEGCMAIRISR